MDQGMSASDIASVNNCSTQMVQNILALFSEVNDGIERRGCGRSNSLSPDGYGVLRHLFYRHRKTTRSISCRILSNLCTNTLNRDNSSRNGLSRKKGCKVDDLEIVSSIPYDRRHLLAKFDFVSRCSGLSGTIVNLIRVLLHVEQIPQRL